MTEAREPSTMSSWERAIEWTFPKYDFLAPSWHSPVVASKDILGSARGSNRRCPRLHFLGAPGRLEFRPADAISAPTIRNPSLSRGYPWKRLMDCASSGARKSYLETSLDSPFPRRTWSMVLSLPSFSWTFIRPPTAAETAVRPRFTGTFWSRATSHRAPSGRIDRFRSQS